MSKVIFKITFKHPNLPDTGAKNAAHVRYIATRSGVDKTITETDLQKELEKENLVEEENEIYLKYINERPRSHGLFGDDGIEDLKSVQRELLHHKSFVWRAIVSLKEDDARRLGYLQKEKWEDMLRKKVPDLASHMGIPYQNFRWVAAVHMEKGHPHAHIVFWEENPEKTLGVVNSKTLRNIRRMFIDEVFEQERFELLYQKNITRDLLRDLSKEGMGQVVRLVREVREAKEEVQLFEIDDSQKRVPPRLYEEEELELAKMVNDLAKKLPGKGRIYLGFMPEEIKNEVRAIADYILKQPDFTALLERNLKAVEKLTRMYTGHEESIAKARENAYLDIRDRICQIILRGAVESQRESIFYVDQTLADKAVNFISALDKKINFTNDMIDTIEKTVKNMAITLLVSGQSLDQTKEILKTWDAKSNSGIGERLDDIIESAHKVVKENDLWGKTTIISIKDWKAMFTALVVNENEIPKWIYKGKDWQGYYTYCVVNDLWKGAWFELERQRLQTEAQAAYMGRNLDRIRGMAKTKEARRIMYKKNKENVLYREEDLEF